jgi:SAM-dependent methyltransferase
MYNLDAHIAEIYDQQETYRDDLTLIRSLIQNRGALRILEPFCGTGRLLIPLAEDGHTMVGFDSASGMLDRAALKKEHLPEASRQKVTLVEMNALTDAWPTGFDVVLLGGNCLYELGTPEEQERCIAAAAASLRPGGYVYVDNNHMQGELDETWQHENSERAFPTGTCEDGTRLSSTVKTIWFDVPRRLARFARRTQVTFPDGHSIEYDYTRQTHPVSYGEVQSWLEAHAFVIERVWGERDGTPYSETSSRAIFWARRAAV